MNISASRILIVFLACFFIVSPTLAQETTLTIGKAGDITTTNGTNGRTQGLIISTATIDPVLNAVDPGRFGPGYTRGKANALIADVARFEQQIGAAVANTLVASGAVDRVNQAIVTANPVVVKLFQTSTGVGVTLSDFSIDVVAEKDYFPLVCAPARGRAVIDRIKLTGEYNLFTGAIGLTNLDYRIIRVSSGCNGLLGFLGDQLAFMLGINGNREIRDAINNAANDALQMGTLARAFALGDLFSSLRTFANSTSQPDFFNRAIDVGEDLVLNANLNTPSIVLDFSLLRSASNSARILASHAPVNVLPIDHPGDGPILLDVPPNTARTDLYYSVDNSNWTYLGTTTSNVFNGTRRLWGARVIAIGHNAVLSGLESYPGVTQRFVSRSGTCGTQRC
jgi:hypothetical protein